MNAQLLHRGPDEDGFHFGPNIGLAMRRLSIIDVKTGQQPVTNESKDIWLIFNGEIYNYGQLTDDLKQRGHIFRSHSDTETVVHLYEEYGRDCVRHLRGMFAFALWDQKRKILFAARDRLGIKPFYYRTTGREFIFASEIKALLEHPGSERVLNRSALPEYLAFGYLSGDETLYRGIRKLPPGHSLEVNASGNLDIRCWWDLPQDNNHEDRGEQYYIETYRELLEQCVSSHLMSEVPLGVFLSGGLDSSAVAALTARQRRDPVQTFSVGYEEAPYSELPYAKAVAEHLGTQHHEVKISRRDFFAALPKLIWHEDEPIVWPSSVSLYFVARLAREHVVVVLTGEGSDETLAGYGRYAFTVWNSRLYTPYSRMFPAAVRGQIRKLIQAGWLGANTRRRLEHTLLGRDGSLESLYFDNFLCAFSPAEQQELLTPAVREGETNAYQNSLRHFQTSSGDLLSRLLYTDIKTYLVELLMKQDQMSMAASVESRVPFLDHVLVEFAASIPSRYRTRGLSGKKILKSAMRDLLPTDIIDRRKMGFPTPWRHWLDGAQFEYIERTLTEGRTSDRGLLNLEVVRTLIEEHKTGQRDHTERLWRLLNLELWQRVCLEQDPAYTEHITEPMAASAV